MSSDELNYLKRTCTYLNNPYLRFLNSFRLKPSEEIDIQFEPDTNTDCPDDSGDVHLTVKGLWVDTILYEIPLLALTSEAYFRFCDTDWKHDGQEQRAFTKGIKLQEYGCLYSEFGTRRRRDYCTQDLVIQGLKRAGAKATEKKHPGKLSGTSNVHFAMKHNLNPVGTVAHEWFMGIAAFTNDYEHASETALRYWVGTFGEGVLGIALTDTFGTPTFLRAFKQPMPSYTIAQGGAATTQASAATTLTTASFGSLAATHPPLRALESSGDRDDVKPRTYAEVFPGIRQDSGNPTEFVKTMRGFYDSEGIKERKTIVFSDSLNTELCIEYKQAAEEAGFQATFGIGTFLTSKSLVFRYLLGLSLIAQMISRVPQMAINRYRSTLSSSYRRHPGDQRSRSVTILVKTPGILRWSTK